MGMRPDVEAAIDDAVAQGLTPVDWILEGARRLADALTTDTNLSVLGIHIAEREIARSLSNRRMSGYPEDQLDRAPIVLCGPPRTGSTLLHRLLAADPDLRALSYWEARHPQTPRSLDAKRESASWLRGLARVMPQLLDIHPMSVDGPEECQLAMADTFRSWHWPVLFDVPRYTDWLLEAGYAAPVRDHISRLAQIDPERQWVLKSPFWALMIRDLVRDSPVTVCVCTMRDPLEITSSWLGLIETIHSVTLRRRDRAIEARRWVTVLARVYAAARAVPDAVTVEYVRLVDDPVGALEPVYERLGRTVPDQVRRLAQGRRSWPSVRRPPLDFFGLNDDDVLSAFDDAFGAAGR